MKAAELLRIHNEKLTAKNIPFTAIGKYDTLANSPRQIYRCASGHEFEADRGRMMAGKVKCSSCSGGQRRRTHEGYLADLEKLNSTFLPLEVYAGVHTKILHECEEGHQYKIQPSSVLKNPRSCPVCSGMAKKTTESYKQELLDKGIQFVVLGQYDGMMKHLEHQCPECDHKWSPKPHDILNGSGCPSCAKFGFNRGRPAILYYARIWDNTQTLYKIGITNKSASRRLANCGKSYKILLEKEYVIGAEAEAAEQMILEEYKDCKVYAPQFLRTGGATELFNCDILLLDENNS